MAAPVKHAEDFQDCTDCTFTIGLDPNTLELTVMTGSLKRSKGVVDTTNNKSGGWYQDTGTIRKATGQVKCLYVKGDPPIFEEGDIYDAVLAKPNGGPRMTGKFRFNDIEDPILDVQGALIYTFTITNYGPVVKDTSSATP